MDADIKKLKKLTKFMRANGILTWKEGNFEIVLSPQALFPRPKPPAPPTPEEQKKTFEQQQEANLETLLWSSPMANALPKEAS